MLLREICEKSDFPARSHYSPQRRHPHSSTMKRRAFISSLSAASALPVLSTAATDKKNAESPVSTIKNFRVLSPPVVQNPTETGFSVAWMVGGSSTGWVEWGSTRELGHTAKPAHHGLMSMSEYALSARISGIPAGSEVYYRVVTVPVHYKNAYAIERGEPIHGEIRRVRLLAADADFCSLAMVNDTHEHEKTIRALAARIDTLNPEGVIWNGDTCNVFYNPEMMAHTCLTPGRADNDLTAGGWASTRPLFFVPGNHDARGSAARTLPEALTPWAMESGDPEGLATAPQGGGRYCFARRMGPIALIGLDTGEDKPDVRDVFGGMAAYEPYRAAQREWLIKALKQPEIASAPHLIAFCHIPLRGLPGKNDGTSPTGYASYSGFGQKLWMKPLVDAGCQMILSGHTHSHRIDKPTEQFPLYQVVGGGPAENQATLIHVQADKKELRLVVENLAQKKLDGLTLPPRKKR
jgi:predicted phosphodiesterase